MTIKKNTVPKTTLRQKAQLMSGSEIERTLVRLAHEILEKNGGVDGLGLVGIRRRGVPIAERLGKMIQQVEKKKVPVGTLDITFYRDDLSTLGPKPVVQESEIGFSIEGKKIVLVDDVLYTGRTTRAALDALFSHGRPSLVQLLVLIDRGHRELPVEATFVGRTVQTPDSEVIEAKLTEIDDAEKVLLMERGELSLRTHVQSPYAGSFRVRIQLRRRSITMDTRVSGVQTARASSGRLRCWIESLILGLGVSRYLLGSYHACANYRPEVLCRRAGIAFLFVRFGRRSPGGLGTAAG